MAFKAIHHHGQPLSWRRRHSVDYSCPSSTTTTDICFFLKPTTGTNPIKTSNLNSNIITPHSLSSSTASSTNLPTSSKTISSFDLLHQHLSSQNFRQADEETRRLLILLAGEAAQKRGYVFFSEVQFISQDDLKAIDELWRKYSNNRFGYSVQKKIWNKSGRDFTKLFIKIGWMKKLESEVVQYNYRAFPEEFIWEMDDETPPEGHLPLTNALRGTQLFSSILTHPAFDDDDEEENDMDDDDVAGSSENGGGLRIKPLVNKVFKTDYSF